MPASRDRRTVLVEQTLLLLLFALFLLISPLKAVWGGPTAPWYLPYLIWLVIIVLALRLERRHRDAL